MFSDNIDCFVQTNKLIIKTKDGKDFWTNDDWTAEWSLFFNVQNGIYIDKEPLSGHEKPLKVNNVKIEDISTYFYTKVSFFLHFGGSVKPLKHLPYIMIYCVILNQFF